MSNLSKMSHARRDGCALAGPITGGAIALLLLVSAIVSTPNRAAAQGIGATTHAEFDLTQRERVGGGEITYTDDNPGQDDLDSIMVLGGTTGVYGSQTITVEAQVTPTADNLVRLSAEGEHAFDLTGTNKATDVWLQGNSTMLARATLVDSLSLSGVDGNSATVELYFQIRGLAEALILIDPGFADLSYTMSTQVRLSATTSSPHGGGGTHNTSIDFPGGYLSRNLDEQKILDEYVVLILDVDPSQDVPLEISLEIEPTTDLLNFGEVGTLTANGLHRPSFWDNAAELLGVVVRNNLGNALPGATIVASSGFDYPVEAVPPPPNPPTNVILSPVAVADSDLGEYDPAQVPFTQMLDQSGLTVPFTSGQTGFDIYFSQTDALRSSGSFVNNWQSEVSFTLPLTGYIDFDLGAVHTIDRMALWNLSLEDIRVLVSENAAGPFTEVGQYTLSSHVNFFSYNADILDLGGPHDARYVRIQVDSAHLLDPGFTYAIVGEVAVSAITVPEPGSLLMTCWGIAGLTFLAHVRRRPPTTSLG